MWAVTTGRESWGLKCTRRSAPLCRTGCGHCIRSQELGVWGGQGGPLSSNPKGCSESLAGPTIKPRGTGVGADLEGQSVSVTWCLTKGASSCCHASAPAGAVGCLEQEGMGWGHNWPQVHSCHPAGTWLPSFTKPSAGREQEGPLQSHPCWLHAQLCPQGPPSGQQLCSWSSKGLVPQRPSLPCQTPSSLRWTPCHLLPLRQPWAPHKGPCWGCNTDTYSFSVWGQNLASEALGRVLLASASCWCPRRPWACGCVLPASTPTVGAMASPWDPPSPAGPHLSW